MRRRLRGAVAGVGLAVVGVIGCTDGPTAIADFGPIEGIWELNVEVNPFCEADVVSHVIGFSLDTLVRDDGLTHFHGVWSEGPSATGSSYTGQYDPSRRRVRMVFVHTQTFRAFEFQGSFSGNDRLTGRVVETSDPYQPLWAIGDCAQFASARKVADYP
jgi:hypothetical protein